MRINHSILEIQEFAKVLNSSSKRRAFYKKAKNALCVCVCVCACVRARVCVCVCVCVCVNVSDFILKILLCL